MQFLSNIENAQHGTNSLYRRISRSDDCFFLNEKNLKLTPKSRKSQKFQIFKDFMQFFFKFLPDFADWNVEKG